MKVQIINKSKNELPKYTDSGCAGMDVRASIENSILLIPGERVLVPTGLYMALPQGYECQVRPRSGLALKYGITVLNSPGTIDSSYRGEVGIILINHSNKAFKIEPGDRIAQLVIARYEHIEWNEAESLEDTERGECGFGHSGVK